MRRPKHRVTRHQRLRRTLRSPMRHAKLSGNRIMRRLRRQLAAADFWGQP